MVSFELDFREEKKNNKIYSNVVPRLERAAKIRSVKKAPTISNLQIYIYQFT